MKGIVLLGKEQVEIRDGLEKPSIQDDEILIRVKRVGICGSDVESYQTGGMYIPGNIIGHEFSGEIEDVGASVKKLKPGMRVTVNPQLPCNECYWCLQGKENMCKLQNYSLGTTENGAMREYINVKAERAHVLPDNVSYDAGAVVEPLSIAIYAVRESGFKLGDNAVVFGAGAIGLMTIQVLKAAGASKIYVLEPVESKQKRALAVGANKVFKPNMWNKITRLTNKIGPDHIFDCVGVPDTYMTSIQLVKKGGHITVIGLHVESFEMRGFMQLSLNNITMRGVYGYDQNIFRIAINMLEQGKINLNEVITKKIKLEEVPEMLNVLAHPPHEEIKVIVDLE
ncbi:MAG: zinc-dependent alcohol dehydrogenase [Promethearchaeota archaeon]